MSSLRGLFGGIRITASDPGYEHNLLAVHGGVIESKNVSDMAEENAPSPYWLNDDDQVRDWVNAHSTVEIGMLATPYKLKMIQTLMSGWVSDDLNAIIRVCGSVSSKAEADTIRKTINPVDLTSLGQRTRLRIAFDTMPGGAASVPASIGPSIPPPM